MTDHTLIYEYARDGTGTIDCTCGWSITWDRPDQRIPSEAQATQHTHLRTAPRPVTLDL